MVTNDTFRQIALSFPESVELPHFEKASFRFRKKIFATLSETERLASLKLTPEDQTKFCATDENLIYPVPNKWGQQGWSIVNLKNVDRELLTELLEAAFKTLSVKKSK